MGAIALKEHSAFPKLQHYWSLTIWLFSVISKTLVGDGVLPLCRDAVGIFYNPNRQGYMTVRKQLSLLDFYFCPDIAKNCKKKNTLKVTIVMTISLLTIK